MPIYPCCDDQDCAHCYGSGVVELPDPEETSVDTANGFHLEFTHPDGWRIMRHGRVWDEAFYDCRRDAIDALALRRPLEATELYKRFYS